MFPRIIGPLQSACKYVFIQKLCTETKEIKPEPDIDCGSYQDKNYSGKNSGVLSIRIVGGSFFVFKDYF